MVASVAAVAVLSGCVGIPTSGDVVAGPELTDELVEDFIVLPDGPVAGASQGDILLNFINAANSPQDGYAIARQFLTESFREEWNPNESVVVRTGAVALEPTSETSILYELSAIGELDENGRYSEPREASPRTLAFAFEQENGEWRISNAPPGVVLSRNSFNAVFDEHALFYFDPTYQFLVPDVRWFPNRITVPTRIVREMLEGPASWLQSVVLSAFPPGVELGAGNVTIQSGVATVDLTSEATATNAAERDRMIQQLQATLRSVSSNFSTVNVTVNGIPLNVPGSNVTEAEDNPDVESAALVGRDDGFGFASGDSVSGLGPLGDAVASVLPRAATLSDDQTAVAALGGDGAVYLLRSDQGPVVVDSRPGLVAPSFDPLGFVWSATASSVAGMLTIDPDGNEFPVDTSTLPVGAEVVSFDISRDGTRIALYLQTAVGPRLMVAGIVREQRVPVELGEAIEFPMAEGAPIDTAWLDNRTIATLSAVDDVPTVAAFRLGGPSEPLGEAPGATTIVGGNGGIDGIRLLAEGIVLRRGSGGWQDTAITATLLATQQ
jgi:hypothetical protein